jgi:hypothetical protein
MIVLALRVVWQFLPNIYTCLLFWAVVFASLALDHSREPFRYVRLIGVMMNALVTIANGGFMPCVGTNYSLISVWKPASLTPGRLLFLCDRFGGFSIGDFFIFGSLLLWLAAWSLKLKPYYNN